MTWTGRSGSRGPECNNVIFKTKFSFFNNQIHIKIFSKVSNNNYQIIVYPKITKSNPLSSVYGSRRRLSTVLAST